MFQFANPDLLWLLLLVPLMVVILIFLAYRRRKALARFGEMTTLRDLMPTLSMWRLRLKAVLFILAFAVLIFAIARPRIGSKLSEERAHGREMMLVIDVSNSMLAEDFSPNRLDRTRYAIDKLFSQVEQDRVGMVVFAGEAKVQLPITTDYRMARSFTRRLSPSLVSIQGTDLGSAISLASLSFSKNPDIGRVMILITDGEAHDERAIEAATRAAEQGIRIFAIGIGTPEGAPIKIGGEFITDEEGEMVVSRLNEEMLQQITEIGKGGYIRASGATFGLEEIVDEIGKMEEGELSTLRFEEYAEQFVWLLATAAILLLLESLLLDRRNPRLRRFNIFREGAKE
jgi:Ca-activated chloride channel family protein